MRRETHNFHHTNIIKMKKLLKQYRLNSDMQYFEMCIESYINGQKAQAKQQFSAMPRGNRKEMVMAMIKGDWFYSAYAEQESIKDFFFLAL